MQVDRLIEDLLAADDPAYLGTATPRGFEIIKSQLGKNDAQYIAFEIRLPDEAPSEIFILASAPFRGGDMLPRHSKASRELTAKQASDWLSSIAKTARSERSRMTVSSRWGKLIVVVDKQVEGK